jgi:hypothetical protein
MQVIRTLLGSGSNAELQPGRSEFGTVPVPVKNVLVGPTRVNRTVAGTGGVRVGAKATVVT